MKERGEDSPPARRRGDYYFLVRSPPTDAKKERKKERCVCIFFCLPPPEGKKERKGKDLAVAPLEGEDECSEDEGPDGSEGKGWEEVEFVIDGEDGIEG